MFVARDNHFDAIHDIWKRQRISQALLDCICDAFGESKTLRELWRFHVEERQDRFPAIVECYCKLL
jgi:hypothetical protein